MLPDTNDWQYCHPPLHHFLASLVVRASLALGKTYDAAFENIQLLTVLYSTLTVFAGNAIIRESKAGSSLEVWLTALLAFHPAFIILSGSINNDMLTVMLMTYAMLYLMRWYRSPSFKKCSPLRTVYRAWHDVKILRRYDCCFGSCRGAYKIFHRKQLKFPKVLLHASAFLRNYAAARLVVSDKELLSVRSGDRLCCAYRHGQQALYRRYQHCKTFAAAVFRVSFTAFMPMSGTNLTCGSIC